VDILVSYSDEEQSIVCEQPVTTSNVGPRPCDTDLAESFSTPVELLQAIRAHASAREHLGVTWRLQVWSKVERLWCWVPDIRQPRPEEIFLSGMTEGGEYWMTTSGHPEATEPEYDAGRQHLRIIAEVKG
jgi:hypothetical protein